MIHQNIKNPKTAVWLLMPAVILHEMTHAIIAERWAEVKIDWSEPVCTIIWPQEPPVGGYLAAFLAPMGIGYTIALVLGGAATVGLLPTLPLWFLIWAGGNWLYYSFPTPSDLSAIGDVIAARA